jgi:DNA-nicking Smr family endonuclease
MDVMTEARSLGFFAKAWTSKDEVDLHGCSAAVARTVLRCVLEDIRTGATAPRFITLITGRGNKSKDGPVLATVVPKFLSANNLVFSAIAGNDGCLLLPKVGLDTWLFAQQVLK